MFRVQVWLGEAQDSLKVCLYAMVLKVFIRLSPTVMPQTSGITES